jgi:hypothetical protein
MNELKEKLTNAISNNHRSADVVEKCENICREHTQKVLESLLVFRNTTPDRFYMGIVKAQLAVKSKEM